MRYSRSIKVGILKKILPPESASMRSVSKSTGISEQTIRKWKEAAVSGRISLSTDEKSPRSYSGIEKYQLVLESSKLSDEALGRFLRERGLHSEHLQLWDQELRDMAKGKQTVQEKGQKSDRQKIRELEKELVRKDKALAELAALVVLKKSSRNLWEQTRMLDSL
ncbi:MAG: helix-turn-helix domain-containing protein [Candidatus Marinimicrobia bacterium]|nr:helix-turn-helix domain-containing protein [Candidatus Neomarinimicrobiota bacterium]